MNILEWGSWENKILYCSFICNGLVDFNFYFGCVEQGFLPWIVYALDLVVVCQWVHPVGDVVGSVDLESYLILFIVIIIIQVTVVVFSVWGGYRSCVTKRFLHFLVIHFLPPFVATSPGGSETDWIQTVVAVYEFSVTSRNNVADGVGMFSAVGVALQSFVGAASQIVIF